MTVVTHEMMDVSLCGLQGMKWVAANYDGKNTSFDSMWGWAANDGVFEMRELG